jgi:hypothetical protein
VRNARLTMARLLTGVLAGVLCTIGFPGAFSAVSGAGFHFLAGTAAFADTCYTSSGATSSGTTGHGYNPGTGGTQAVQANISFNTAHLVTGDICGGQNFYWIGYVGPSSGGTYCGGGTGFAQDGWSVYDNGGTPVYKFFSYYQDGTGNAGCGPAPLYPATVSSGHTYKVTQVANPYVTCYGYGSSELEFWMDSTLESSSCVYWTSGQSTEEETERYGTQTHIGAIGYWWTEYCQDSPGSGCTPNTYVPAPSGSGYVESDGYSYITYLGSPNFNTCDARDFTSSTC